MDIPDPALYGGLAIVGGIYVALPLAKLIYDKIFPDRSFEDDLARLNEKIEGVQESVETLIATKR